MPSEISLATIAPYASYLPRPLEAVAADLESFSELLTKWNRTQNLVSRETGADLWHRHIADSLQLLRFIRHEDLLLSDIGSGGGFPALPLAVALKGSGRRHVLVEAIAKKSSFLRAAIRELGLAASVEASRAEALAATLRPDVITARAVAPLVDLLGLCQPLFGANTRGLFHKGREYGEEVQAATHRWCFDVVEHRSDTDPRSVVLEIKNLQAQQ